MAQLTDGDQVELSAWCTRGDIKDYWGNLLYGSVQSSHFCIAALLYIM